MPTATTPLPPDPRREAAVSLPPDVPANTRAIRPIDHGHLRRADHRAARDLALPIHQCASAHDDQPRRHIVNTTAVIIIGSGASLQLLGRLSDHEIGTAASGGRRPRAGARPGPIPARDATAVSWKRHCPAGLRAWPRLSDLSSAWRCRQRRSCDPFAPASLVFRCAPVVQLGACNHLHDG
jgi:hypothetical protein